LIPEREPEKQLLLLRKAAGAQIVQSQHVGETVKRNINAGLLLCNWNEFNPNAFTSINWRASLVPAAAVIPAPIAYIKVVAVKTLVVEVLVITMGYLSEYILIVVTIILIYARGNSFVYLELLL
jgi:hypothetical protein